MRVSLLGLRLLDTPRKCRLSRWSGSYLCPSSCVRRSSSWDGSGGANVGEELISKDLMKEVLRHHIEIIEEFQDPI